MNFCNLEQWRDASARLDDLLDCDDDQRASCLVQLGASDPALARCLERILHPMGQPALDGFLSGAVDPAADAPESLVGTVIGRHVLEAFVGRGASASVWRARRLDIAGAPLAIKLLHGSLVGRPPARRFQAEADWLQRVAGRGIPRWHESGIALHGRPYLALDYVPGLRITTYCDEHRLTIAQRLALASSLAGTMARVHGLHVLHGDIKPDNVLVTDDGLPMLVDFGIAVDERCPGRDASAPICTPAYAAPEQLAGSPPSRSTDIYSLGALLRRLLEGRSSTERSSRSVEAGLDALVARTLDADPARRPASMHALRRQLSRLSKEASSGA